jgi:hypothetical protein
VSPFPRPSPSADQAVAEKKSEIRPVKCDDERGAEEEEAEEEEEERIKVRARGRGSVKMHFDGPSTPAPKSRARILVKNARLARRRSAEVGERGARNVAHRGPATQIHFHNFTYMF